MFYRSVLLTLFGCIAACAVQVTGLPAQGSAAGPSGNPAAAAQQKTAVEPARLSGRVAHAATGEPLKRVNIILFPTEPGPDFVPASTITDAEGAFAMTGLPPGKYRMSAERAGFVRKEFGARGNSRTGTTIALAAGQELKEIDFRLEPHAVITGRVTDEEGEPLPYVHVQTMTYRYVQGRRQLTPFGGSQTNDLGEYRIFGLPPGRYYLSANYNRMGMMGGAVDRSASNQPEEGFASTYYPATNDPSSAVQIAVSAGKPVTGMDIRLRRSRTLRIRGRITNLTANSIGRAMVMLTARDSGPFQFERNMTPVRGNEGNFEMRGVTPGSYYLTAQSFDGQNRQSARVPVDVGSSNVEGVEMTLSDSQEISGTVKVEGEAQVNPSSIRIYLEAREQGPMSGGGMSMTKEDGTFVIRNVMPDTYRVRVMAGQNQVYVKSVILGQQEAAEGEISISAGVSPALSVLVSTAGAQVSGGVRGDKDAPVQGAMVVLVPEVPKRQQPALYKFASTDQYGRFSLSAIAPGEYKLFAWDAVEGGEWMDPDFLQVWENKGKSISVKENSKEAVDLALLKVESGPGR